VSNDDDDNNIYDVDDDDDDWQYLWARLPGVILAILRLLWSEQQQLSKIMFLTFQVNKIFQRMVVFLWMVFWGAQPYKYSFFSAYVHACYQSQIQPVFTDTT
jgi:hypothetical protein